MCRFALYMGPEICLSSLVTDPVHSIIDQSFHSEQRREPLNGDGFGVAWYAPALRAQPAVFKDIRPAWNDRNLLDLARVIESPCILAHVRAASPGLPVTRLNCHPFSHARLCFMHNGSVAGFKDVRRRLLARLSEASFQCIEGSTDSEHLFALFLDCYRAQADTSAESMALALRETTATIDALVADAGHREPSNLNLVVTDGTRAVVSRYIGDGSEPASLYLHQGARYVCEDGVCRMLDAHDAGAVLVASEPLSRDAGWAPVPPNHMLIIERGSRVEIVAFDELGGR